MTVKRFMETMKNETTAITFIINCLGTQESYTKQEITKLIEEWGKEEVNIYFMLNTREMVINIK